MTKTFLRFGELPAEVRLHIWHFALPLHDKASLFPLRTGHWQLRPIPPSDPAHDPLAPAFPRLEFRHDLLAPLECSAISLSPMFWVSGEARHVATAWARQNGFEVTEAGRYRRGFDPKLDVVYLVPEYVDRETRRYRVTRRDFYDEIFDKLQSPEALAAMIENQPTGPLTEEADAGTDEVEEPRKVMAWGAVERFAMPMGMITMEPEETQWALLPHFFPEWKCLYILPWITNGMGSQITEDEDMPTRRRFDLDHDEASHKSDTVYVRKKRQDKGSPEDEGPTDLDESTFTWEGKGGILANAQAKMKETSLETLQSISPWSFSQTPDKGDVLLMAEMERQARDLEASLRNTNMTHRFEIRAVELPKP
ncbi:hypothetical protein LIA77_07395 [Sarocladium implicatum]|nr:hypothetical protein LIA77_07395 [Sarocladium implicatum]